MTLQEEIDKKSKEIFTDKYPMSIGEIINLYRDGELDIHPEFQRIYRWTVLQKTKLIESIMLGIPIPPIFVSQRGDGVWDVIDGVQRLSTIFEFIGIYKDDNENIIPPLKLFGTDYLPSFEGKMWSSTEEPSNSLTDPQRLFIKRAKIDFNIIKKESDPKTKFELFQRLNTLGSRLTDQEVRNCLLVMTNPTFYRWLRDLADYPAFKNSVSLSENLIKQQYDLELVLRFIGYKNSSIQDIRGLKDVGDFLTKKMMAFATDENFGYTTEANIFRNTFDLLERALGEESFKRYDFSKTKFVGPFLISPFEVVAIGLATNIERWIESQNDISDTIISKVKSIWRNEDFTSNSGSGSNATQRLPVLLPLGKELFSNVNNIR